MWIPFVTIAEMKAGFLCGSRSADNEGLLAAFLALRGVGILFADRETTDLRRAGTPIPTNDLWIAGLAIQHHLVLLTRDEHFAKVPEIGKL